ncbi:MAG: UDP-N-acetylmuramoyl-L-alanyl-D-glutamate--2,6-diaminopimelate ligase [Bacteroidota bacterium]
MSTPPSGARAPRSFSRFTISDAVAAIQGTEALHSVPAAASTSMARPSSGPASPAGAAMDSPLSRICFDSRAVTPGSLFVAIRGEQADGHLFIDTAVQNGAVAVVYDDPAYGPERFAGGVLPDASGSDVSMGDIQASIREGQPASAVFIRATDARAALAGVSGAYHGHPSQDLLLAGVTGTNGKTTTSYLLYALFERLGRTSGLIGTIENRIGREVVAATHTTPDPVALQALFRRMVDDGCDACAMEVSSHALHQERVRGTDFDAALFTNLTHDHLDYHGNFENYWLAKKKLFDGLRPEGRAVVNRDDIAWAAMVAGTPARVTTYGFHEDAHVRVELVRNALDGLRLRFEDWQGKRHERTFKLAGRFNALNLAAAYATCLSLELADPDTLLDALAAVPPVPGRFETITSPDGIVAVVDYAHTPDALENVLATTRAMLDEDRQDEARLTVVFGCGGDRDRTKRPAMGAIAERLADRVVLTSDNPRTEDPQAILTDILGGLTRPGAATVIADRAEALQTALADARPGDVVVVAGKGHEPYQIIGTEKRHFDDREQVRQYFAAHA